MEGMILGNRYELVEKVGGGGMANVYKAKCHLLNRFVAVKILRPEFTTDNEFIERFKVESQAAGSLSHPNIVSIYDVGTEKDINYIVMEYVDGITLKEYIVEKGKLPWKTAVNIAIQICSALEHAHKNHIVHRDIKPHNIIITKEMVAKVADFGIARAVSSSTLTMTGNTIGSVHYFSPEQARGGYTDEKSDLYSMGIVIYEMLTGKVPFDGDTPVTIALKHLEEEILPPNMLDNTIPASVNDIVIKAVKKNQVNRYQSAAEMLDDLYLSLRTPESSFVKMNNQSIDDIPTQRMVIPEEVIKSKNGDIDLVKKGKNTVDSKKEKATIVAALATSLVIILLISAGIAFYISTKLFSKTVVMKAPNIVGMQLTDAKELLEQNKITLKETERRFDQTQVKDAIISQNPPADMEMKAPGEIEVVISNGQEYVVVPDLTGMSYKEAENELKKSSLLIRIIYEPSDMPKTFVFKQQPLPSTQVSKNSEILAYVSDGPQNLKINVPNLIGLSEDEARRMIRENKLILGKVTYSKNTDKSEGFVLNQSVAPNTEVSNLTKIDITVNKLSTNTNQDNGSTKYITIDISNKGFTKTFVVNVEVDGIMGKKLEYSKTHSRDEGEITVPVQGSGNSIVRVYIDDKLDSEMVVDFGEGE